MYRSNLWPKLLLIALLLLAVFTAAQTPPTTEVATAQNDNPITDEGIFEPVSIPAGQLDVTAAPEVLRGRLVTINSDALTSAEQDQLTVNPFAGLSWTAVKESVTHNPTTGSYTWHGRLAGVPQSQATFVVHDGIIIGKIAMPGAIYEVRYTGQSDIHEVVQINQGVFKDHEVEQLLPPDEPLAAVSTNPQIDPQAINAADNGSVMDVLVVYSPQARAGAGGTAAIEALIELAFAETNIAYENSQVNQRISLVHLYESPDDEKSNMFGPDGDLALLRSSGDGYIDNVHDLRNQYHADFVLLIINSELYCGLGYLQNAPADADFEDDAFAVVRRGCVTGNYSFGHELGHNMGLQHDWYSTAVGQEPAFTYAHGHVNLTEGWRTIMGTNNVCDCSDEVSPCPEDNFRATPGQPICSRLIYFSNDEVDYFGDPMGVPAGTSAACAPDTFTPDPTSCDADNEAVLNSNALSNSRFRTSQITWLGNSTDWNDPNNWEMVEGAVNRASNASSTVVNRLPRAIDDVYIPAVPSGGNFPVINGAQMARNVLIANGASLTINSGSLTVYGNWEEQGSGSTAANGGTLFLDGTLPQTIKLNNNSYFNNIEIGSGGGASTVRLISNLHINGHLTISGSSSLQAGSGTIRVAGDWTQQDANSFEAQTSTVILDGTAQTVTQLAQGTTLLTEDFSAYDGNDGVDYIPPSGWRSENNGDTVGWQFSANFFGGGPGQSNGDGHAYRRWVDGGFAAADAWLFTSAIEMDAAAVYEISFDYGTLYGSSREDFDITLSTAQTAAASHIIVQSYADVDNETWLTETLNNVTVPSSGTYYLGIHSNTEMVSGDDSLSIDDIVITELQLMSFYNLQVNSSTAAAFGQNLVVNNQLQVNPNGVLDLSGIAATAEKTVINNGTIQESKNAAGGTTTDFIMIENAAGDTTTYYGVQLIDPAGSMGSTTVALAGGQNCGLNLAKLINRCYEITPTTNQNATVRFYFSEADRNGQNASTSNAWHWNVAAWVGASSTDGYVRSEATPNCLSANGLGCYIEAAAVTDYSPFALAVSQPEIQLLDEGADVVSGMGTVDLGSTTISNPITKDIVIANVGLTDLTLSNLSLPSGFSQIGTISDTVTAGTSTTLTIQLDASAVAFYTGTVSFNTNDSDENPFSFTVEGNVTATPEPEIQLFDGVINILDGSGQIDFGTTVSGEPVTKLLTVKNVGTAVLTLGDLDVPTGYSGQFASTTVDPNSSTVFTLTLTAAAPGIFSGTVAFDNTDVSESLYDFAVTGNVVETTAPEVAVLDNTTPLTSGSSLINMGLTSLGNPIVKTFTVQNNGNADLELSGLVVSGGGFSLVSGFSNTTITPGSSTTFAVQFNAAAVGVFNGAVSFDTNDEDENPFTFDLTAESEVKLYLPAILLP